MENDLETMTIEELRKEASGLMTNFCPEGQWTSLVQLGKYNRILQQIQKLQES